MQLMKGFKDYFLAFYIKRDKGTIRVAKWEKEKRLKVVAGQSVETDFGLDDEAENFHKESESSDEILKEIIMSENEDNVDTKIPKSVKKFEIEFQLIEEMEGHEIEVED
ncbi:hypothetical protein HHI36_005807 [Cryptolaemus montrouzieri]|uniref:Uncharacterized protein n=1 Tax=Cryptolaemus montrouzieri TaxID=559131 RepID=A0ABD2NVQ1_9CUCU